MKLPTNEVWKEITDIRLSLFYSRTWNHLTVYKKMSYQENVFWKYVYLMYMCEVDLALNNLQWLIYHKTLPK